MLVLIITTAFDFPVENRSSCELKGPVKSLYQTSHSAKKSFGKLTISEELEDIGRSNYVLEFNSDGLLKKQMIFRTDTNYALKVQYKYDNQKLSAFESGKGGSPEHNRKVLVSYTSNSVIYTVQPKSGVAYIWKKWTYNPKGQILSQLELNSKGDTVSLSVNSYSDAGLLIKIYQGIGLNGVQTSFLYNDFELPVKVIYSDGSKTLAIEEFFYKNEKHLYRHTFADSTRPSNEIKSRFSNSILMEDLDLTCYEEHEEFDAFGKPEKKLIFKRDSFGRVIKKYEYDGFVNDMSAPYKITTYEYDEHQNLKVETDSTFYWDRDVHVQINAYDYDNHGNWIRLVHSKNGMPVFAQIRKIEYY